MNYSMRDEIASLVRRPITHEDRVRSECIKAVLEIVDRPRKLGEVESILERITGSIEPTVPPPGKVCCNCDSFYSKFRECRFCPPSVVYKPQSDEMVSEYPTVAPVDWCSKFKYKGE